MLRSMKTLFGRPIVALDGEAGKLQDLLFDDQTWSIRYLVAETGNWRESRPVVIPAVTVGPLDSDHRFLPVYSTVEQVRTSPLTGSAQTVSGRYRRALQQCRFLPHYWVPEVVPSVLSIVPPALGEIYVNETESANLRSAREVIAYRVEGIDGEIGKVSDLVVDDATWVVNHILVRAGFWLFSRTAPLSPGCVEGLSWLRKDITAAATCSTLKWFESKPRRRTGRSMEHKVVGLHDRPHKPNAS